MIEITSEMDGDDLQMDEGDYGPGSDRDQRMNMYNTQNMKNIQQATAKVTGKDITE